MSDHTSPALAKSLHQRPSQRLPSSSLTASSIIHLLGLTSFTLSFRFLSANPNEINQSYGWHFQYLTIIGLSLATLTFIFGFLADISSIFDSSPTTTSTSSANTPSRPSTQLSATLFYLKNTLSMCSAPLSLLITTLYFTLRAIDPTLVVPADLEIGFLPDMGFHLFPTTFLLIDFLSLSPPWTIGTVHSFVLSLGIAVSYWMWIEHCFARNGFYPYPIFGLLSFGGRVGLFTGSAVAMGGLTYLLKMVYAKVNSVRVEEAEANGTIAYANGSTGNVKSGVSEKDNSGVSDAVLRRRQH